MENLIANSGIQIIEKKGEFNFSQETYSGNKKLSYSFFTSVKDNKATYDVLLNNPTDTSKQILLKDLDEDYFNYNEFSEKIVDAFGLPTLKPDAEYNTLKSYNNQDAGVFTINNLNKYTLGSGNNKIYGFEKLLNKWLPMPMFEIYEGGTMNNTPMGWCKVKIVPQDKFSNNDTIKYNFIWAIDTQLADVELSTISPVFFEGDSNEKQFELCNRFELLFNFMFDDDGNENEISNFISEILNIRTDTLQNDELFKHISFYLYLINYIRLNKLYPEITLHNNPDEIPVDFVLDIGNSRTCGILFEKGDFTKAKQLEIRDLSDFTTIYSDSFDMRFVFRKPNFNDGLVLDNNENEIFNWRSIVRVGKEASKLIYKSIENIGLAEKETTYSSPKRYLWDNKPFHGFWEFLTSKDDPLSSKDNKIYAEGLSEYFDDYGNYYENGYLNIESLNINNTKYSRSSLMTFVLIEILQHAFVQINSIKFRERHGNINLRRVLRNLILTTPTAMPKNEQIRLREAAKEAYNILIKQYPSLKAINVLPSPNSLRISNDDDTKHKEWSYDEASACQLVYLFAESNRYKGDNNLLFDIKGHIRKEDTNNQKSLTIGSVDIGAGTTDIMIASYASDSNNTITPRPLFWDSFYLAGDDILKKIVETIVIDGKTDKKANIGSIHNALLCNLTKMTSDEYNEWLNSNINNDYKGKIRQIIQLSNREKLEKIESLATNMLRDYFGIDSNNLTHIDRSCRKDFNIQIAVPIAQRMLENLRTNQANRIFTYDELFIDNKPAEHLLKHFKEHFRFNFEDLCWQYDKDEIEDIVRATVEPLMKQLASILYIYNCDEIILAGRPTSLNVITELFVKYYPISPDRLVRLNDYLVGNWYPFADGNGYFYDQKSVVAVGAMIGSQSYSTSNGINKVNIDFTKAIKTMNSTANYIGIYNTNRQLIDKILLTPEQSSVTFKQTNFPLYLGCKQFNTANYQPRILYALYNDSKYDALNITLTREYSENKEVVIIEDITDSEGNPIPQSTIKIVAQSLANTETGGGYWLDKGEFELSRN